MKRLRIIRDEDCESPRENDNLGTMVCWHPNYTLGDVKIFRDGAQESVSELPTGSVVLKLYLYDHSGLSMKTVPFDCPWDSGGVGYIYITPETMAKEGLTDYERVAESLEFEVKVYDQYLRGACWGFVIDELKSCEVCGHGEYENIDSCWGFIGDTLEETGIDVDDAVTKEELEKAWENRL